MGKTFDDHLVDVILELLSEHLECYKLLLSKKSCGVLGVFNSILVGSSDFLFIKRIKKMKETLMGVLKSVWCLSIYCNGLA